MQCCKCGSAVPGGDGRWRLVKLPQHAEPKTYCTGCCPYEVLRWDTEGFGQGIPELLRQPARRPSE